MASKPKLKADSKPQSKDLVKAVRRTVFIDSDKARKLREDKPTTSRALVLRNAKLALQGNLDAALKQRMSGREKLDLLAGGLTPWLIRAYFTALPMQKTSLNKPQKPLLPLLTFSNASA